MNRRTLSYPAFVFFAMAASGCAPSLTLSGTYFPAWIVCMIAGLSMALLCRAALASLGVDRYVSPAALAYPCLALALTFLTWLTFYSR